MIMIVLMVNGLRGPISKGFSGCLVGVALEMIPTTADMYGSDIPKKPPDSNITVCPGKYSSVRQNNLDSHISSYICARQKGLGPRMAFGPGLFVGGL